MSFLVLRNDFREVSRLDYSALAIDEEMIEIDATVAIVTDVVNVRAVVTSHLISGDKEGGRGRGKGKLGWVS